jgi:predicted nucleic acid-binding protein
MVRGWKRTTSRKDEAALERERQESKTLSVFPDLDGMYVVRGKLPPEVGLLLMRAIEAAGDQIYRERPVEALETDKAAARRRADALTLLAERAMAAGLGRGDDGDGTEPLPVAGALDRVRGWLARPNVTFLVPGTRHLDTAFRLLEQLGTASNFTTDAQLAAHAIEHGREVHSNDGDFGRFDGLRWVNPLASV